MKIMMLTRAMLIDMLTGAIFYVEIRMKANNELTIPYTNVDECKVRTPIATTKSPNVDDARCDP